MKPALGIVWFVMSDTFGSRVGFPDTELSRRVLLSNVSSIYDPDGRACAFVLPGKRILQEVTTENSDWDAPLTDTHVERWKCWRNDVQLLESVSVPRCYVPKAFGVIQSQTLHCFSDASATAYGQASYLRSVNSNGEVHVSLVSAKSRVAPLRKYITIPRLELTAFTVSVKTGAMLKEELGIPDLEIYFWTDSTIVLGYLTNKTKRFRTFVANRVSTIHEYSQPHQWRHVSSEDNPADFASRGISPACTEKVKMWFGETGFLWEGEEKWPKTITPSVEDDDPEIKQNITVNKIAVNEDRDIISILEGNVSSWLKLV